MSNMARTISEALKAPRVAISPELAETGLFCRFHKALYFYSLIKPGGDFVARHPNSIE